MKLLIEIQENRSCDKDRPERVFVRSSFISNDYDPCNNKAGCIAETIRDKSFTQALEVARLTPKHRRVSEGILRFRSRQIQYLQELVAN